MPAGAPLLSGFLFFEVLGVIAPPGCTMRILICLGWGCSFKSCIAISVPIELVRERAMNVARPRRACRTATNAAGLETDASEDEAKALHPAQSCF
eukprot:5846842-Pleurochrysis_carterae.AAC.1